MKVIRFTLLLMMLCCLWGTSYAQNSTPHFSIVSEPKYSAYIPNTYSVGIQGMSANDRYIWGNDGRTVALVIDLQDDKVVNYNDLELDGVESSNYIYDVVSVANSGEILIMRRSPMGEEYSCFMLSADAKSKQELTSPNLDFPYVDARAMTPDAQFVVGNLGNSFWEQQPYVASRNEDGTYTFTLLKFEEEDAMGATSVYNQALYVTADGSYVMGKQTDWTGQYPRFIMWEKQSDGSYLFTTPLDHIIYDLSAEKPGAAPDWDDYVTIEWDENMSEEDQAKYDEQEAAFYKADSLYYVLLHKRTRNQNLDPYAQTYMIRGNAWGGAITQHKIDAEMEEEYSISVPLVYEPATKKTYYNADCKAFGNALASMPSNAFAVGLEQYWPRHILSVWQPETNKAQPFHEWLQEMTGVDISKDFISLLEDGSEDVTLGVPYFSASGKSLLLTGLRGVEQQEFFLVTLNFDRDIFADPEHNTPVKISTGYCYDGRKIVSLSSNQVLHVSIYSIEGTRVAALSSIHGEVQVQGQVPAGNYIAVISSPGNRQGTPMKITVR